MSNFTVYNPEYAPNGYIHITYIGSDEVMQVSLQDVPSAFWDGRTTEDMEDLLDELKTAVEHGLRYVQDPMRWIDGAKVMSKNNI